MELIDKNRIAANFKAVRELQGLSHKQLVERSRGMLTYSDLSKLEAGHSALTSVKKREGLARALALPMKVIEGLAENRMTPDQAVQFAKDGGGLVVAPDREDGARKQGEDLAIWLKLDAVKKSRFPRLELCLAYHEANGHKWPEHVVALARDGKLFPEDLPTPAHWKGALDRLEQAINIAAPPRPPEKTPRNT